MRQTSLFAVFALSILFSGCLTNSSKKDFDEIQFKNPPSTVRIHTWWHWIDGRITREGITKDLESMHEQGIVQATILNVGMSAGKDLGVEKILFNSEQWYDMFMWALQEAERLEITIGVHNCDGWSESGGPWVTPEMSMKKFVFTKTMVYGKKDNIQLPRPLCETEFYRDVAVIAYKNMDDGTGKPSADLPGIIINGNIDGMPLADGNPESMVEIRKNDCIRISNKSGRAKSKISLMQNFKGAFYFPGPKTIEYTLKASDDGIHYRKVADIATNKFYMPEMVDFPATNAKYFQIEVSNIHNLRPWHHAALAELQLFSDDEDPAYNPTILYPLEKTASARILEPEKLYTSNSGLDSKQIIPLGSIVDLTDDMKADGTLNWENKEGNWSVIRFGYTTTGAENGPATKEGRGLECDKLDTAAVNLHFRNFPQKLVEQAGKFTGKTFKFLLIDSWERGYQTWTQLMPQEFENLRGYDIINWIPVLCGETIESTELSEAFLYDFRKTIADLFEQNYYRHFSDLCHKNGLELHGEVMYGDTGPFPPVDILRTNSYMDMPMYEFWAEQNNQNLVEYVPSSDLMVNFPVYTSNFYGKSVIGAEAYTGFAHYSESPSDLKLFGDRAYCSGITQMILHSYVHQPAEKKPGLTLGQHGSHFNRHNSFWQYAKGWSDYQARIQYILQNSKISAGILYYLGDQLPQFFENKTINNLPEGYQSIPCNYDVLRQLSVENGKIKFSEEQSYSLLVLPDWPMMEYQTLEQVARLVKSGAVVYGTKPEKMFSLSGIRDNKKSFEELVATLWSGYNETDTGSNTYGKGKVIWNEPIGQLLTEFKLKPDFTTNQPDSLNLMYIHRNTRNSDVFFVVNQQDSVLARECFFNMTGRIPEIWDAVTGEIKKPAVYYEENGQIRIPVTFKPKESLLFIFSDGKPVDHICKVETNGKQIFHSNETNNKIPEVFEVKDFKGKIIFSPVNSTETDTVEITEPGSFTDFSLPEIKYFSGTARYIIEFDLPEAFLADAGSISLSLGKMDATARVSLNNEPLGFIWMPNTELPVKQIVKSQNRLEIELATTCRNRIIGDLIEYGDLKNLWTSGPVKNFLKRESPLKPSGIEGPLRLIKY